MDASTPPNDAGNGAEFRKLRTEAGLLQSDLAARVGISVSHLSYFENGHRPISPKTHAALIEALAEVAAEQRAMAS